MTEPTPTEMQIHKLRLALTTAKQYIEQEDTFKFGGAEIGIRNQLLFQIYEALKGTKP